jgi:hypothetical protein
VKAKQDKECGTCFACCIQLGIEELRKWPGRACKHLDGAIPDKRCSIYEKRPQACSRYRCLWLNSDLPDEYKPENSGILMTPYQEPEGVVCTVSVFDRKAGDYENSESLLHNAVRMLLDFSKPRMTSIRIIYAWSNRLIIFSDGCIRTGRLLKARAVEDLTFEAYDPPIGHYHTRPADDNREAG